MRRLWVGLAMAISLAAITAGGVVISQDDGPPAGSAHIWVDTTTGDNTCVRSSPAIEYDSTKACSTFDAAYDAASAGDTVRVNDGSYSVMSVSGTKASDVTFIGETQAGVVATGASTISGTHARFENMTLDSGATHGLTLDITGSDITLVDFLAHGDYISTQISGADFTWDGGELGEPAVLGGERTCGAGPGGSDDAEPMTIESANVLISDVAFGMFDAAPAPACSDGFHLETMRIHQGASNVTVRSSSFESGSQDGTSRIFITSAGTDPVNLLFENNFFGEQSGGGVPTFKVNDPAVTDCSTYTFAYNTFVSDVGGSPGSCTGADWIGNLGPWPAYEMCSGTHTKNVWQDSFTVSCGTDTTVIGTRLSSDALGLGGAGGWHLQAGSDAIDAGEADSGSDYCTGALGSVDNDGDARPFSSACDAGADERTS